MMAKKRTFIIITCVVCLAIALALILPITLGKYFDKIFGYTEFGAERFNAAIIPYEDKEGENTVVYTLSAKDFRPGMMALFGGESAGSADTAVRNIFYVANGTEGKTTNTALSYTVRLRTSNSLPLKYTLKDDKGNYYETLPAPTVIDGGDIEEDRYEYMFNPVPKGTTSSGDDQYPEATFSLDRGTPEAPLVQRLHELIAEWPSTIDSSSAKYMKEVEMIEIVVTVTSLNNLEDENYGPDNLPGNDNDENTNPAPEYSDGIVLIIPPQELFVADYTYAIDLRSFRAEDPTDSQNKAGIFNFKLSNAIGMGIQQPKKNILYEMEFKVPLDVLASANNYDFEIYRNDLEGETYTDFLDGVTPRYRVYDKKTGMPVDENGKSEDEAGNPTEVKEYTSVEQISESLKKDPYGIYAIYKLDLGDGGVMNNTAIDNAGDTVAYNDVHHYTIKINTREGITLDKDNEFVFANKLELLIKAEFKDVGTGGTQGS